MRISSKMPYVYFQDYHEYSQKCTGNSESEFAIYLKKKVITLNELIAISIILKFLSDRPDRPAQSFSELTRQTHLFSFHFRKRTRSKV